MGKFFETTEGKVLQFAAHEIANANTVIHSIADIIKKSIELNRDLDSSSIVKFMDTIKQAATRSNDSFDTTYKFFMDKHYENGN